MPPALARFVRILVVATSLLGGASTAGDPAREPPGRTEGYVVEGTLADGAWRGAEVVGRVVDRSGALHRVASGTVGSDGGFRLRLPARIDPLLLSEVELARDAFFGGCVGRVRVEDEALRITVLVASVERDDGTSAPLDLADRADRPSPVTRVGGFLYADRASAIRGTVACERGAALDEVRYAMELVRGWQPVLTRVEALNAGHVLHENRSGSHPGSLVWRARP